MGVSSDVSLYDQVISDFRNVFIRTDFWRLETDATDDVDRHRADDVRAST